MTPASRRLTHPGVFLFAVALAGSGAVCTDPGATAGITPETIPDGVVGEPYSAEFGVYGHDTPVSSFYLADGDLPEGLEVSEVMNGLPPGAEDAEGLRIEGVPTEAGSFHFTLRANTYGTMQHGLSLAQEYELTIRARE